MKNFYILLYIVIMEMVINMKRSDAIKKIVKFLFDTVPPTDNFEAGDELLTFIEKELRMLPPYKSKYPKSNTIVRNAESITSQHQWEDEDGNN